MAQLNKNYPEKCSNKEIKELIREYSEEIYKERGHINTVLQFTPMIQLGLSELQNRQNKKIAYLSLSIGIISLLVAAVALYISINSGNKNYQTNKKYIESLDSLNQNISEQSNATLILNKTLMETRNTSGN